MNLKPSLFNGLVIMLSLTSFNCFSQTFGAALSDNAPISLNTAIDFLNDQSSINVVVEAKVDSVCEKKGCWMALKSADNEMRVTFKDYGFFVPFNIVGKQVTVEGVLEKIQMSLEESKHMVQDAGGDPKKVTQPISEFRMIASGVRIKPE